MIRCKYCQLAACTCGQEDWEEYMTGGEAKDLLDKVTAERDRLRDALENVIIETNDDQFGRIAMWRVREALKEKV